MGIFFSLLPVAFQEPTQKVLLFIAGRPSNKTPRLAKSVLQGAFFATTCQSLAPTCRKGRPRPGLFGAAGRRPWLGA